MFIDELELERKHERLKNCIRKMGSALVAFSGGVDSSLVLAVSREVLGDKVIAATIDSPLHPRKALEAASRIAEILEVRKINLPLCELDDENFVSNPPSRCYVCKHSRFARLSEIALGEGLSEIVDGTIYDDKFDFRPGMAAASELGVRSPLLECGLTKEEVRALARMLDLPNWNAPSSTCFATRIPYSQRITREKLKAIEEGERFLKELGFKDVRLRFIEDRTARIEVAPASLSALVSEGTRERIIRTLKGMGFVYVTCDMEGYRKGSLNEVLF